MRVKVKVPSKKKKEVAHVSETEIVDLVMMKLPLTSQQ